MAFRRCLLNGAFVWFSLTHSLLTGGSVSVLDTSKYHYMVNWMGLGQVLTPSRLIDLLESHSTVAFLRRNVLRSSAETFECYRTLGIGIGYAWCRTCRFI